jgi:hypothetical protein
MGRILILLCAFISSAAMAATPGNAPILTIAAPGQQTQALSIPLSSLSGSGVNGVFSLYGAAASATAGNFYALYKNGGTQYQVTSGKTAYCENASVSCGSAGCFIQVVSATGSFNNTSGPLTSGAFQGGASAIYPWTNGVTTQTPVGLPGTYTFAPNTFVGFQTQNGTQQFTVHIDCFEQ